jgi:restriction system protein
MALWLVRTGKYGQHESRFLTDNRLYLAWDGLTEDLSTVPDRNAMVELLRGHYPLFSDAKLRNHSAQIWAFVRRMSPGDWVVVPSKAKSAIHVAEIAGRHGAELSIDLRPPAAPPSERHAKRGGPARGPLPARSP